MKYKIFSSIFRRHLHKYHPYAIKVFTDAIHCSWFTHFPQAIRMEPTNVYSSSRSMLKLGEVFHDMNGMLLGQNLPPRLPTITSSRLLVATWLVFAVIFTSAYRGNLTASLTLPKYPPRPETLPQLVDSVKR